MKEKIIYRYADALAELMKTKQFDEIKVTDITSKCSVSRQIFYHHFEDKYNFLITVQRQDFQKVLMKQSYFIWNEHVLSHLYLIQERKHFYKNAVKNDNTGTLFNAFISEAYITTLKAIEFNKRCKAGYNIEFVLKAYLYGAITQLFDWIRKDMSRSPEEMLNLFYISMPEILQKEIEEFKVPIKHVI